MAKKYLVFLRFVVKYTLLMWDTCLDALLDGLKIFPFILLIYIVMEIIENARRKENIERVLSGPFAPAVASALGAVPECGFAVMCAKLYDKGLIKIGTLIAAFISVSDEGIIILATNGARATDILLIVAVKIVYAVIVGETVNLLFAKKDAVHICPDKDECIECGSRHERGVDKYFLHPLVHALKILAYVIVINIVLGAALYFIGDKITDFIDKSYGVQPLIASVIGLIPNCGSSIILAESFTGGVLGFSGLIAGLAANAGIGVLILFRSKKNFKKAFFVIAAQYVAAVILGYAVMLVFAI